MSRANNQGMSTPHPRSPTLRDTPQKRFAVILFILSPLAVLTILCVWMYFALKNPPQMNEPAKGAGAGKTGLSNEYMGLGRDRPQAPAPTGAPPATGPQRK